MFPSPLWPPTWSRLLMIPALLLGYTLHELAHAIVALTLGDTTQVARKRLSLNPLRHISITGTIAFLLVGAGWAKPVRIDANHLRTKDRAMGMFLVAISGVSVNIITAMVTLLGMFMSLYLVGMSTGAPLQDVWQYMSNQNAGLTVQGLVVALTYWMLVVNLVLGLFNILPVPGLDGFTAIVSSFAMASGILKRVTQEGSTAAPTGGQRPAGTTAQSPAQIHFDIGLQYHKEGQLDEAIARYRQAIAQDDGFTLAYYNLGVAYWAKDRLPLAVNAFKSASQSSGDGSIRTQAELRLSELAQAEEGTEGVRSSPPPPLEAGEVDEAVSAPMPPLDPGLVRRLYMRLTLGGAVLVVLEIAAWTFVNVTLMIEMSAK